MASSPLDRQASRSHTVDNWQNTPVWVVTSPDGNWQAASVKSHKPMNSVTKEKEFVVVTDEGTVHSVKSMSVDKFNLEFQWVKKRSVSVESVTNVSDMTSLPFLNEPEMLECMRSRFNSDVIYTNTGPILIAINPFQRLPLYSNETLLRYTQADDSEVRKLEPHVYQISERAYRRMFIDKFDPDKRENQSILVNGESGAGKTESTKQVLHYLARVSSEVASGLGANSDILDFEKRIIAANPITESFGNAKTSRNNNSSRFGKFIELGYVPDGYIEGAKIRTYLLETVRVTTQMPGERNYHIFYECFAGLTSDARGKWGLSALQDFAYCNQSGEFSRHDGESDRENFEKLKGALSQIGLSEEDQAHVFKVVACVLHIGNLAFQESSIAGEDMAVFSPSCRKHVDLICSLLCVDEEALLTAVSKRSVEIAGSSIQKFLNVDAAEVAKHTFARTLYDTLFKRMIEVVNQSFSQVNSDDSASFVAVLDIFGFEFFKNNSFEQMCINYANEKLQDHFNYAIFKSEQEVYKEEGIEWTFVEYPDNSERLDLFEHKFTGIFALCNEQLKLPKPTDQKLAKEFYSKCGVKNFFQASKKEQAGCEFVVQHFACDVKYSAVGFLDKNRSEVASEISACFSNSKNEFVRSFLALAAGQESNPATNTTGVRSNRSVGKKTSTVSSQFSKQLQDLVNKIRSTRSHFIRCIKPNNSLVPNNFDYSMVMSQLRCGGALGAIQVFRAGFPNRMDFAAFVSRFALFVIVCGNNPITRDVYKSLAEARQTGLECMWRTAAAKLIDIVALTDTILHIIDNTSPDEAINIYEGLQLGKTQVFLRAPLYEFLEALQLRSLRMVVRNTQRRFRAQHYAQQHCVNAVLNAILWFFDHKKRMAVQCVTATILLQRRAKIFLLVCSRKKTISAITRLKAHFRGARDREYVKNMKFNYATRIQTRFRSYFHHKRFCSMREAAVVVQKLARSLHAKAEVLFRIISITQIQAVWRGAVVRATSQLKDTIEKARKKKAIIEARRKAAAESESAYGANRGGGALSISQKLLEAENKSLKKRVRELEKEVERLGQSGSVTAFTIDECESISNDHMEVPDASQDEEIQQLKEALAKSQADAAMYKDEADTLRLNQSSMKSNSTCVSEMALGTESSKAYEARIGALEKENEILMNMTMEAFEKHMNLLKEYNAALRRPRTRASQDYVDTSRRKQQYNSRASSSSISTAAWTTQISARVVSFKHVDGGSVEYTIAAEATEGRETAIKWNLTRTYCEFRGLRKCIELREEDVDAIFPKKLTEEEENNLSSEELEKRRVSLDSYLSQLCLTPAYIKRPQVGEYLVKFLYVRDYIARPIILIN